MSIEANSDPVGITTFRERRRARVRKRLELRLERAVTIGAMTEDEANEFLAEADVASFVVIMQLTLMVNEAIQEFCFLRIDN